MRCTMEFRSVDGVVDSILCHLHKYISNEYISHHRSYSVAKKYRKALNTFAITCMVGVFSFSNKLVDLYDFFYCDIEIVLVSFIHHSYACGRGFNHMPVSRWGSWPSNLLPRLLSLVVSTSHRWQRISANVGGAAWSPRSGMKPHFGPT